MMQPEFNKKILQTLLLFIVVFGSALSWGEEYFQDAVFEELQKVGVDAQTLKSKINEGDFSGAKTLLEEEKDKTTLTDVEEEVANLIARKVVKKVRLSRDEIKQNIYEEKETAPAPEPMRNMPVEKVKLDDEEEKKELPQLKKQVSSGSHIPGEEVNPLQGLPKAVPPQALPTTEIPAISSSPQVDKEALYKIGVRELHPGMSIFRFLKVQVKVWSRLNHPQKEVVLR